MTKKINENEYICLICHQKSSSMKEFNVSRHFQRKHQDFHKYGPDEKMKIYKSLETKYLDMKTNFSIEMSKSELVTLASLNHCERSEPQNCERSELKNIVFFMAAPEPP